MHARTFPTKGEATRWAKEMETDVRRGEWVDPRLARTTFAQWAAEYLTTIVHLRAVRGATTSGSSGCPPPRLRRRTRGSHIEQVDIRRFLAEKQAAGLAPKTLQKIRLVLRQILEAARGSGAIKANPCHGVRLPRAQQKEPIFLTAEQVDLLARSANGRGR